MNTYDAINRINDTVSIIGEETKSWRCFSTYMYLCDLKDSTDGQTLGEVWSFMYFFGTEESTTSGTEITVKNDLDLETVLKELT